jgi:hypothetical protein
MLKKFVTYLIVLTALFFTAGCPETPPESVKPPEPEPAPTVSFHDKCAGILENYVDDNGMVDYKVLSRRKTELSRLLNEFAQLDPDEYSSWSKEDKIAFWINAYNIKMLEIITNNYPIESSRILRIFWPPDSIRHIKGIWDEYKFIVMDEEFTLKEVERRFFRREFDEPRAFLAISYASRSSPPLRNEPYYGRTLYEQLDDQAEKFLSKPLAFRVDRQERIVCLSAVFQPNWFGKEFISKYGTDKKFKDHPQAVRAVLSFAANYISRQDVAFLEVENYSIKYINYNWRLNSQ